MSQPTVRKKLQKYCRTFGGNMSYKIIFIAVTLCCAHAQDMTACCNKAVGTCRSVCEKMSVVDIRVSSDSAMREERIENIYKFCAPHLIEFWICMNQTIQELVSGSGWWGRACCARGQAPRCRHACAAATDARALHPACRRSDELPLLECVQRQHEAQWCCSQTQSLTCHEACQTALWAGAGVATTARARVLDVCEQSPTLLSCFRDLTSSTVHGDTAKYLPCCQESPSAECRTTCEAVLRRTGESQEIFEGMSAACGAPAIHDAMWQCFLRKDSPSDNKDVMPHDAAKLHCCYKAVTINCRRLCFNTFSSGWHSNWQTFYTDCLGDPQEIKLSQCIEEVETPCSLGCAGLTYCSHMNNRPNTLFRSCTPQADFDAHIAVASQRDSGVVMVAGIELPLRNSSQCPTELWKSVACALHVKPCTYKGHSSQLCAEDCYRVVKDCVEWSRALPSLSAHALCGRLAPTSNTAPCLQTKDFSTTISQPPLLSSAESIRSPCAGAQCNSTQVCVINRNCLYGPGCAKYICLNGCPLGDDSPVVVPRGVWVRVPLTSTGQKACYKICQCGPKGFTHCQPLPCYSLDACRLHDNVVPHSGKYYMECNECICYGGERICSSRACATSVGASVLMTRLPCNCPPHHLPVTTGAALYPNACLAKCAGASDAEIEHGTRAWCSGVTCGWNLACVPRRIVCLSRLQTNCPQYVCVNTTNCGALPPEPVCDNEGRTYQTPCSLLASGRRFAYWGECLLRCSKVGQVCGMNGVTYSSECAAWADLVSVDYGGPCLAVGPISNTMEPKCKIDLITCPPIKRRNCLGFTGPGACCPKCGGALRILFSKKQIDRALYATNISSTVMNLNNILKSLTRHVTISECVLRGYLTIEMEIFVTVESILDNPTDLQLNMCVLEAEKLADLINRESALITTDLGLSALSYALVAHTVPTQGAAYIALSTTLLILSFISLYFIR